MTDPTPADIPSLVEATTRIREVFDRSKHVESQSGMFRLDDVEALLDAISPKEAELVKPPREYEVSGNAVGGVIQADRDKALTLLDHNDPRWWAIKTLRRDGDPLVQALCQHRLAYTPKVLTASHDAARERIARIIDPYGDDDGSHVSYMAWQIALEKADAILAALPTTDGAEEPTAYRVDWWVDGRPRMRVQLSTVVEPWLGALKPTFTPLYAATPPTTDASERMREALDDIAMFADVRSNDDSKTFARVNRGALRTIRDKARAALAPSNNEVSGDK